MKSIRVVVLLVAGLLNVYMLFAIILFKLAPVEPLSLLDQLQLVVKHPQLLEARMQQANFQPFYTIGTSLGGERTSGIQWLNLYGNILVFIPTGVLIALSSNKHRISNAAIASFLLSLLLESMQLIFLMGAFDVDDLILNSLGGIVGAMLIYIPLFLRKRSFNRRLIEQ